MKMGEIARMRTAARVYVTPTMPGMLRIGCTSASSSEMITSSYLLVPRRRTLTITTISIDKVAAMTTRPWMECP